MQDKENNDKNDGKQDVGERVYELGYLLVPTIKEEDVPLAYGNLKELLLSFGGVLISDEIPKMIPLAYTMFRIVDNVRNKFDTAYFGWSKFTMDADEVLKLKAKLDLDPQLIRFLIIKTVKENTIAEKRFIHGVMRKKPTLKKGGESVVTTPINKEEIDKEIEALVAN